MRLLLWITWSGCPPYALRLSHDKRDHSSQATLQCPESTHFKYLSTPREPNIMRRRSKELLSRASGRIDTPLMGDHISPQLAATLWHRVGKRRGGCIGRGFSHMVQTSLPVRNDSTHIQTYHERMWQLTMVSVPKQESSGSHRCRTEARAQQLKAPSASACPRQYFGNQKTILPRGMLLARRPVVFPGGKEARSASRVSSRAGHRSWTFPTMPPLLWSHDSHYRRW
jgi:hypothetical protein